MSKAEVKRKVSELCGLGGIIPTPRDRAIWTGNAVVESSREVLGSCSDALERLLQLSQWLQSHALISDHLIIFRGFLHAARVEAVHLPLSLITELKQCVAEITAYSAAEWSADHGRKLSAASDDILRFVIHLNDEPYETLQHAVHRCALAVQALCVAMLFFGQGHIGRINPFFLEHSLSHLILQGTHAMAETSAYRTGYRKPLHFQLVRLSYAGDMIDSEVMAFMARDDVGRSYDLSITIEDSLALWGPGTFISYASPRMETKSSVDWLFGIAIRGGVLHKPSMFDTRMHWTAGTADNVHEGAPFRLDSSTKVIIGAILVDQDCPTEPGPSNTVLRTNISSDIKELGTSHARWEKREIQFGVQAGQFLNPMLNMTSVKRDARTRKEKGLERVDLDFLNQPWGLLVSICTGIAQRVALREVVAEVIPPIWDASLEGTPVWQTVMSIGDGLVAELKKSTFRDWFNMLDSVAQNAFGEIVSDVLYHIRWTGVNDDGKLVMACPQFGDSDACIHVPLKYCRAFAWILKDTERTATFACLTNMCFIDERQLDRCQTTSNPQWRNHISALITSVCQYQWLGADDWVKLPRHGLQGGSMYWMGTSEDKRRAAIGAQPGCAVRLAISDSSARWRFFRRIWERIERVRQASHIELRERRSMTEDHAQDVMIVRE
jgi:hypothetical protein